MRERTTWNRAAILREARIARKPDPYTPYPNVCPGCGERRATKYVNGDPAGWAESIEDGWTASVEAVPERKTTARRVYAIEPDFGDTADDSKLITLKADLAVRTARLQLGPKASEDNVEDQAVALMSMSDADLIETWGRQLDARDAA